MDKAPSTAPQCSSRFDQASAAGILLPSPPFFLSVSGVARPCAHELEKLPYPVIMSGMLNKSWLRPAFIQHACEPIPRPSLRQAPSRTFRPWLPPPLMLDLPALASASSSPCALRVWPSHLHHNLGATDDARTPSWRGRLPPTYRGAYQSVPRPQVQVLDADFERLSMTVSDGFHSVSSLLEPDALQRFVETNPQTPPAHLKGSLLQCTAAQFEVSEGGSAAVVLRIGCRPAPPAPAQQATGTFPSRAPAGGADSVPAPLSTARARPVSGVWTRWEGIVAFHSSRHPTYPRYPGCSPQPTVPKPSAAQGFGAHADGTRPRKVLPAHAETV